ncbi:hypothetical protein V5O48_007363 [Marasmius crinis-equi]|uniref:Uncharacterized protein n=1 Tax=Marasmius crinis-equi TaxID=585013 RepID=A0ABR3FHD7_9AGAR
MFLLYAVARPVLSSTNVITTSTLTSNVSEACKDITRCRTLADIFKSCLTVVFISIWVSMHPDVPDVSRVGESDVGNLLNELIIMTFSIFLPELIILWAMRQRHRAGIIAEKYRKYGWTKPHAFLAIMGGLALYDKGGNFRGYLRDSDTFQVPEDYETAEEIEDCLKGPGAQDRVGNLGGVPSVAASEAPPVASENNSSPRKRSSQDEDPVATPSELGSSHLPNPWDEVAMSSSSLLQQPPEFSSQPEAPMITEDHEQYELKDLPVREKPQFLEPYSCLLEYVLDRGLINLPESEIKGNINRGDIVAKLSAIFSTGWFWVQIAARAAQGLLITEIEVVTLIFTVLSFAGYLLWLDKPQRVRFPVRVTWECTPPKEAKRHSTRDIRRRILANLDEMIGNTPTVPSRQAIRFWLLIAPGCYPMVFLARTTIILCSGTDKGLS